MVSLMWRSSLAPRSRTINLLNAPNGLFDKVAALPPWRGGFGLSTDDLAQAIVRQRVHDSTIDAGHRIRGHHRIHDCLLGGLDRRGEERVHRGIPQHLYRVD